MWVYWTFALLVSLNAMHSDLCCLQTISFSSCTNPPPVSLTPFQGHGRGFFVDIGSAENEGGGGRTGSARTSVLVSAIGWYPKVHRASHPPPPPLSHPTAHHWLQPPPTESSPHPLSLLSFITVGTVFVWCEGDVCCLTFAEAPCSDSIFLWAYPFARDVRLAVCCFYPHVCC